MTAPRRAADAPDERSLVSARLLLDLVGNPLDPGYAAAARRRGSRPNRHRFDRPIAAAGALLIGFLLVVAYTYTNRGAPEAQRVHDRLVDRVRTAQDGADKLAGELGRVEKELASEQAKVLPPAGALARGLKQARSVAGQLAVYGPGLVVTLREPPAPSSSTVAGRAGSVPITDTNILSDRDVRSVVNELWHDGAEAIAVNGIRLTPTSAIRFAGQAVLVDFQPITSPYRIEAIGDADLLSTSFAQSAAASRYQTLAGTDHIGFSFEGRSRLDLPASGPVTPRFATPAPSPTKSGTR
ncbi:MAG: DUF881 domain-containing protein [Jatrophihabitans sp.]